MHADHRLLCKQTASLLESCKPACVCSCLKCSCLVRSDFLVLSSSGSIQILRSCTSGPSQMAAQKSGSRCTAASLTQQSPCTTEQPPLHYTALAPHSPCTTQPLHHTALAPRPLAHSPCTTSPCTTQPLHHVPLHNRATNLALDNPCFL